MASKPTNISSGSMLSALSSSPQDWWVNPEPPRSTWILDSLRMFLCRQICVFVGNVDFRKFVLHGTKWFPILAQWFFEKDWFETYQRFGWPNIWTCCMWICQHLVFFIHMHHDNSLLAKEVKWFRGPNKHPSLTEHLKLCYHVNNQSVFWLCSSFQITLCLSNENQTQLYMKKRYCPSACPCIIDS